MNAPRLDLSHKLATAFSNQLKLEAETAKAKAETEAVFQQWAAGRRIDRDRALCELKSVGLL